jgi:hypothetical protein
VRSVLGLVASALAGFAAVIASLDGDGDIVPFFVGLTFLGGVAAWAAHPPFAGRRRVLAQGVALVWLIAATWVSVLLVMFLTVWGGGSSTVSPDPAPEQIYLGLPATIYHLAGLYVGGLLVVVLAFGRSLWLDGERADTTTA